MTVKAMLKKYPAIKQLQIAKEIKMPQHLFSRKVNYKVNFSDKELKDINKAIKKLFAGINEVVIDC